MECIPALMVTQVLKAVMKTAKVPAAKQEALLGALDGVRYITGTIGLIVTEQAMSSVTIIGADPTGASSMARIPFPPNAVHMLDELKRAQNEDRTVGVAVTGDDFRNATLISVMVFAAEADPKSNKRK